MVKKRGGGLHDLPQCEIANYGLKRTISGSPYILRFAPVNPVPATPLLHLSSSEGLRHVSGVSSNAKKVLTS